MLIRPRLWRPDEFRPRSDCFIHNGAAAASNLRVIWDSATMTAGAFTLTNSNLTAERTTADSGAGRMIVSSRRHSAGAWYCEITVNNIGDGGADFGIGVSQTGSPNEIPGANSVTWGYRPNGNKYFNGGNAAYGDTYTTNDVIMVAFNANTGKIWFGKNGTWQASGDPGAGSNEAYSGLSGSLGAAFGGRYSGGAQAKVTANFGASAFSYTVPSGFSPGWR